MRFSQPRPYRPALSGSALTQCLAEMESSLVCHRQFLCHGLLWCVIAASARAESLSDQYQWQPLRIGGTGWVTGMVSHPTEATLRFARTDVGGFYRWDEAADAWEQLLTADRFADITAWDDGAGVTSVALAPSLPSLSYVAVFDRLYFSADGGDHYTPTDLSLPMDPNGTYRMDGERLAVDPVNPTVAYFGSNSDGLWTTSTVLNWTKVNGVSNGTSPGGVLVVKFDPNAPVINDRTSTIYAATHRAGVFRSTDAGQTWSVITGTGGGPASSAEPSDLEVAPDGSVYVTYRDTSGTVEGLWRYRDTPSGPSWQKLTTLTGKTYTSVAIDPFNPDRLVTATNGMQQLYYSTNGGANWTLLSRSHTSADIDWVDDYANNWISTGEFYFDPVTPNRLWMAHGIGVSYADMSPAAVADKRIEWEFESKGIEETVTLDLVPLGGGHVMTFGMDITGFLITDNTRYNARQALPQYFSYGWDGAVRPGDPTYLVTTSADYNTGRGAYNNGAFSTDGGANWQRFASITNGTHPADLKYGTIAVSADGPGYQGSIVWVPGGNNEPPFYSLDGGASWHQPDTWLTSGGDPVPTGFNNFWFRWQGLVSDPDTPGTFYMAVKNVGLAKTTDGGRHWFLQYAGLPQWGHHARLLMDPLDPDAIYYANGEADGSNAKWRSGLWRSTDGGASFEILPGLEYVIDVALGAPAPDGDWPTIYALGELSGQPGVYRSIDDGVTWDFIEQFAMGLLDRPRRLAADPDVFGRVYLGMGGSGFVVGDLVLPPASGDANGDGRVDGLDLDIVIAHWRMSGAFGEGDFSGDGFIDLVDLGILASNWQPTGGGAASLGDALARSSPPVPEPASVLLLAIACLPAALRRRRCRRPVPRPISR